MVTIVIKVRLVLNNDMSFEAASPWQSFDECHLGYGVHKCFHLAMTSSNLLPLSHSPTSSRTHPPSPLIGAGESGKSTFVKQMK